MRISDWSSDVCSSDLLPDTHSAGAGRIAQDILESIRALNIEHSDHPLGLVTASAGITTCRPSTEDVTPALLIKAADRSEERRVGKECVSTCRYRWSPNH